MAATFQQAAALRGDGSAAVTAAIREVLEKIDWLLAEMSIEGALSFLDEIADEIEDRADRIVAYDQSDTRPSQLATQEEVQP